MGSELTRGLGAGANPDIGQRAALESYEDIAKAIEGLIWFLSQQEWVVEQGTGGAPVVAKIAKEMGVLCIGVVTKPFIFEGKKNKVCRRWNS